MFENNIYDKFGIRPLINAGGWKTACGGTKMSEVVVQAMAEASKYFVDIEQLNYNIGKYIAKITHAEAGMVTSGAASGVVLSIAACMTGCNKGKIRRLPSTNGMKSELIIQKMHRIAYSQMYAFSGAKLVEIGSITSCLKEELEEAINESTAAVAYIFGPRILQNGLKLSEVVEIAHKRNVPVIVDAAAMLPPKINLHRFIEEGADLVTFSGGKIIKGPQATGILCGKKELINAALLNSSPQHAIGRPHKVSKEDIVGLYVALRAYVESDEQQMFARFYKILNLIIEGIGDIKGIQLKIIHDNVLYNVPVAVITAENEWKGPRGEEVVRLMRQGTPSVFMLYLKDFDHLVINPVSIEEAEVQSLIGRLREVLLL